MPASNQSAVVRGVDLTAFARRWGRAGAVASVVVAAACAPSGHSRDGGRSAALPAAGDAEAPIAPPPAQFDGPPPAAPALPATLVAGPPALPAGGAGLWSVVIGIGDYPGTSHDLAYTGNDAADMDAALARAGQPASQRVDLRDGQATGATMLRAFDWLVAHAGPDSTAVVFYAGHVRKLGGSTEALVGADGRVVSDREMAAHLAPLRASRTWIVMAACYGGGFTETLAPGRILTAAAPANSLAYETSTYHRSYLGEYLVHRGMLEGLGGPTVQSAFAYATEELRREHPNRMPVEFDQAGGPLTLGSGSFAASPRSSATTTVPPSSPSSSGPSTTTTTTTAPGSGSHQQCLITAGSLVRCSSS